MSRLHVHTPWRQRDVYLPFLLERRLQPEFALLASDLDSTSAAAFRTVGRQMHELGLSVTVHAPFMDLNPGASDPLIAAATRTRLRQTLDAAAQLEAQLVVIHPGYDRWRYNDTPGLWLDGALTLFRNLLEDASPSSIRIAVENIFEERPESLCALIETVNHPQLGHCFDIGHWQLFGSTCTQGDWLASLGNQLFHLHLHDNHGSADDHLPLGEGSIDFTPLANHLAQSSTLPSATLEAHSRERLLRSLHAAPGFFPGMT